MKITTNVHTIFMLIGATESGKTTFAKEVLMPQLKFTEDTRAFKMNVQYISSDAIRRELLGYDYHKYDQVMMESSEQTFRILFEKLKAVTSFPINAEFVIVDTIGLSEEFRNQVREIAKEQQYNLEVIVFDYVRREDFYASEESKKLISTHVDRLKRDVLKQISRSKYSRIHRIREKNFFNPERGIINQDYQVIIEGLQQYVDHILPHQYRYIIIGDVHEKIEELKQLLTGYGFTIEQNQMIANEKTKNVRIILIGDFIDKGKATKETIDFIYRNQSWFYLVKGNHENFVYKYLRGELDEQQVSQELLDQYFDSIKIFEQDEELRQKFFELVQSSREFYRYIGNRSSSYFLTHAPCRNKYIGKLDSFSLRKQRYFRINREEAYEDQLNFLKEEAVGNHPFHIFGHVAVREVARVKNKINIDTGCASGNELTSIVIDSGRLQFRKQKSHDFNEQAREQLPVLFAKREKAVDLNDLVKSDQNRLEYIIANKVNFISGTMSPSDKFKEKNELESLEKGLLYYKNHGIEKVVLQPKYMGSRCNLYLSKEADECYAVSRNGYKISRIDLTPVYEKMLEKFASYMKEHEIQILVLDGELLPWSVLGEELIDRQFNVVNKALEIEQAFLGEHGFDAHFNRLKRDFENSDFEKDQHTMPKKALKDKYGDATYRTYKNLAQALKIYEPLEKHREAHQNFNRQLNLYGQWTELDYKPFQILKFVKENGENIIPTLTASEQFSLLSEDDYKVINLNSETSLEEANQFYQNVTTENQMEGIVIKPEVIVPNIAPYLKVRNPNYLTLVYGYDYQFPHKYEKLINQKDIKKKVRLSINEYDLGQQMLKFPLTEITDQNNDYKQVVANMLFEVTKEDEIDPRL